MLQNKIRGSLIGGAIGDALGYPVEFVGYGGIVESYGEKGITRFDLEPYWLDDCERTGKAIVSDDTQMTLFTANGIMNAQAKGIPLLDGIQEAYLEWLFTQTGIDTNQPHECWLTEIPELNVRRAPGNTCITSLTGIAHGYNPINHSKGCGGVMRIAPIPLYAAAGCRMDIIEADKLAGDAARITHHHPLGYIPAAILSHIIYRLVQDENPTQNAFEAYVREGMEEAKRLYSQSRTSLRIMDSLIEKAFAFSVNDHNDGDNVTEIGGGWVAEETLAIAIYCVHRHFDNFENAIVASVNHGGDSDSTGAVTGNIIGTIVGYDGIPQFYKDDLELSEVILRISDELASHNEEEFVIKLTIDGTEYEDIEVKVSDPNKTIREQINSIIRVFELPRKDNGGNCIQYLLGQMLADGEEPEVLELEDEDGRDCSLLDYNIQSGDCLHLLSVPIAGYACPVPVKMEKEWVQYYLRNN